MLRRDVAEPGDVVAVTGPVGGAGAAVAAVAAGFQADLDKEVWSSLRATWSSPDAHIQAGRALVQSGVVCRMSGRVGRPSRDLSGRWRKRAMCRSLSYWTSRRSRLGLASRMWQVALTPPERRSRSAPRRTLRRAFSCHPGDLPKVEEALGLAGQSAIIVGRCEPGADVWVEDVSGNSYRPQA